MGPSSTSFRTPTPLGFYPNSSQMLDPGDAFSRRATSSDPFPCPAYGLLLMLLLDVLYPLLVRLPCARRLGAQRYLMVCVVQSTRFGLLLCELVSKLLDATLFQRGREHQEGVFIIITII